jgi:PIN domain nuclease of toxin-antitoxin system
MYFESPIHADPFDRLLIAQAGALDVPILTGDRTLARYAAPVIDATH